MQSRVFIVVIYVYLLFSLCLLSHFSSNKCTVVKNKNARFCLQHLNITVTSRHENVPVVIINHYYSLEQGVTLTGRSITGPPSRAAPWWVTLHMCRCYRRRRQTPVTIT